MLQVSEMSQCALFPDTRPLTSLIPNAKRIFLCTASNIHARNSAAVILLTKQSVKLGLCLSVGNYLLIFCSALILLFFFFAPSPFANEWSGYVLCCLSKVSLYLFWL